MHAVKGYIIRVFFLLIFVISFAYISIAAPEIKVIHWSVGGVDRQALVYVPEGAKVNATPVMFVFHGHGGNMNQILRGRDFDKLWPEAIIISPQGLNTPGRITDPDGRLSGWQNASGHMNDRDLLFFDAMLKTLHEEYRIDDKRIYATGHSNGGAFTYLLMETRSDVLAAAAPSAAAAIMALPNIKPKPLMHIMGEMDPLVKPEWQEATIKGMMRKNNCSAEGKMYATDATIYSSGSGNPVVVYKHKGGHTFPQEANAVVIHFFKSMEKP